MNYTQFLTWPGATVVPFESMLDGRRRAWSVRIRDPYRGACYKEQLATFGHGLQDLGFRNSQFGFSFGQPLRPEVSS